jgi:glycosyltransferase 2 family protein
VTPRRAFQAVALAAVVVTGVLLVVRLDERRIVEAFEEVSWGWVAACAAVNIANSAVEAWRWTGIASAIRPGIRVRSAFLAIVSGIAGGLLLPFKLGDGVKAYVFSRAEELTLAQAIETVVADRLVDLVAFSVMALGLWLAVPLPGTVGRVVHYTSGGLAAVLALAFGLARWRRLRDRLQSPGRSRAAAWLGRALSALANYGAQLPVGRVSFAAAVSWATRAVVVWCMAQAFHLHLPPIGSLVTLVVINVGIAVTGVPANVGSFELSAVGALQLYAIAPETAVDFAIALHATELLPLLGLGALLALTGTLDVGDWRSAGRRSLVRDLHP